MFYLVCKDIEQRTQLIELLKKQGILSVFHYISLHKSPFYQNIYIGKDLVESDRYSNCLLRMPMYYELDGDEINRICKILFTES